MVFDYILYNNYSDRYTSIYNNYTFNVFKLQLFSKYNTINNLYTYLVGRVTRRTYLYTLDASQVLYQRVGK